ncbi:unnamed protein product, partial [Oppiella nova]
GVTFMPLSPTFEKYEVEQEVRAAGADVVMTSAQDFHKFEWVLDDSRNDNKNRVKLVVIFDGKHDKHVTYEQLRDEGKGRKLSQIPHFDVNPEKDMLFLIHTSGTTGAPKCAMIPHRCVLNKMNIPNRGTGLITSLIYPMGHKIGSSRLPAMIISGSKLILFDSNNAEHIAQSVEKYGIQNLGIFPHTGKQMVDQGLLDKYDLSTLKIITSGGAAFPANCARAFIDKFKLSFREGYGMTEYPALARNRGQGEYIPGNCGRVSAGTEVKVVDLTTGESLGPNTDGEICVRGVNLIAGYLNNPKAWEAAVDGEGWYRT